MCIKKVNVILTRKKRLLLVLNMCHWKMPRLPCEAIHDRHSVTVLKMRRIVRSLVSLLTVLTAAVDLIRVHATHNLKKLTICSARAYLCYDRANGPQDTRALPSSPEHSRISPHARWNPCGRWPGSNQKITRPTVGHGARAASHSLCSTSPWNPPPTTMRTAATACAP